MKSSTSLRTLGSALLYLLSIRAHIYGMIQPVMMFMFIDDNKKVFIVAFIVEVVSNKTGNYSVVLRVGLVHSL